MADFLAQMAAASRARAEALLARTSLDELRRAALASPAPRPVAPRAFTLITEVKLASPSEGTLASTTGDALAQVVAQARRYAGDSPAARPAASIISVLTEPSRFAGDLSHARAVADAVAVPVMRKDFLVSPAQVYEARLHRCAGVLLILRMQTDDELADMLRAALECGLFVLLEAFDSRELARAQVLLERPEFAGRFTGLDQTPTPDRPLVMVGLNTRDLCTLAVNPAALDDVVHHFPPGFPRIAESGLATPADAARVSALGYTGALVGSALMRSAEPDRLARGMLEAAAAHARLTPRFPPPSRTRVKICGLTDRDSLAAAIDAGADAVGCVFAPSPRQLTPDAAAKLLEHVPPMCARVAVFKSPTEDLARAALSASSFTAAQSEHADAALFARVAPGLPFIHVHRTLGDHAHGLVRGEDVGPIRLIEGPRSGVGERVDWTIPARYAPHHRVVLAGGLNPDNVGEAIQTVRPFAVDVSSGVESAPGKKDPARIRAFIAAVRDADRRLNER